MNQIMLRVGQGLSQTNARSKLSSVSMSLSRAPIHLFSSKTSSSASTIFRSSNTYRNFSSSSTSSSTSSSSGNSSSKWNRWFVGGATTSLVAVISYTVYSYIHNKTNHQDTDKENGQHVTQTVAPALAEGAHSKKKVEEDYESEADKHSGVAVANHDFISLTLSSPSSSSPTTYSSFGTPTSSAAQLVMQHDLQTLPVEVAVLTIAPQVPPPVKRDHPVLLKVNLFTSALVKQLTNRYKYMFWTFNDVVPGPMIRARVGDVVELNLKNIDSTGNPHNIDCHAFEGPGGGAPITTAQEGETKTARFKLLYPGLYVYHCAAAPVPAHVMNGMYGLMLVEPEYNTLPRVDREYYVMQSEFYHEPLDTKNSENGGIVEPSYPRGLDEDADVVVFNGKEGALTTDKPLQAKTGERVRIYFGNAGPNLTSSFHVIGSIFEKVFRDGDLISPPARFVQTISVPPGGSSVVDMHMLVPGTYTLVDHAIFRLDKGAVGYLNVTGAQRPDLYSGGDPQPCPGCKLHP